MLNGEAHTYIEPRDNLNQKPIYSQDLDQDLRNISKVELRFYPTKEFSERKAKKDKI